MVSTSNRHKQVVTKMRIEAQVGVPEVRSVEIGEAGPNMGLALTFDCKIVGET